MRLAVFLKAMFCSLYLRFRMDLGAALGAGDDDFPLAHRHPADGAAGLAGKVFVILVGVACLGPGVPALDAAPPVPELLVLCPPLRQVL